jgi:hypothetical protein
MKRKVGRPKLNRPPVARSLISVLKKDALFIQMVAKEQHRSVTQVFAMVTELWRRGMPALVNNMGVFASRDEDPGHERVPKGFTTTQKIEQQELLRKQLGTHTRR